MGTPAMTKQHIKALFANDIHRRIEEVIKVDQTDEEILRDEISEYVVTDAIRSHYTNIYDAYRETSYLLLTDAEVPKTTNVHHEKHDLGGPGSELSVKRSSP